MKRTIAFLLALALALSLFGCGKKEAAEEDTGEYTETTLSFADSADKVKLLGRARIMKDGLHCDWPASGVEFRLDCEGTVSITLNSASDAYYQLFFDGHEMSPRIRTTSGEETKDVITDVPAGVHTFRIVRDSDLLTDGTTAIQSVTATCRPSTLTATVNKDIYVEFIGDALTSGFGSLYDAEKNGNTSPENWGIETNSAVKSFAYLTAQKLGADYSLVSVSGIGVAAEKDGKDMRDVYRYWNAYEGRKKYDFARKPDVIVCALGMSDADDETFVTEMRKFVKTLRDKNGKDCKIVFACNMLTDKNVDAYSALAEELGGIDAGYHIVRLPRSGDVGYLTAANAEKDAAELATVLNGLFPGRVMPKASSSTTTTKTGQADDSRFTPWKKTNEKQKDEETTQEQSKTSGKQNGTSGKSSATAKSGKTASTETTDKTAKSGKSAKSAATGKTEANK